MRLTKKKIDGFRYRGGWDVRWDDAVPGLGVRLHAGGARTFVVSYRAKSRKRLMKLGRYGVDLTLDQARQEARDTLSQVRKGVDPLDERKRDAQGRTFADLRDTYIEKHAKRHKKTWREDERRLHKHIPTSWESRLVGAITREDIASLYGSIGAQAPYEANRLLALLRVVFRLGQKRGFLEPGAPNPAEGFDRHDKFKEVKRKRWVTPQELPYLARAIDTEPSIHLRAGLWLSLLTGVRRGELLGARWVDIDFDRRIWRLPDTKAGEEQRVSLSDPAIAILQALPRFEKNPFILPAPNGPDHLTNIGHAWRRIREIATVAWWGDHKDPVVADPIASLRVKLDREPTYAECVAAADLELPVGLADIRLHDLRRTTGSWMSQAGVDLNVIKDGLRHQNISTTLTYARLGEDASREAMEEHGRSIIEAAGKHRPVEVAGGGGKR